MHARHVHGERSIRSTQPRCRRGAQLTCVLVIAFTQTACGKAQPTRESPPARESLPTGVVASVAQSRITVATLTHLTAVEAVLSYERGPGGPIPKGVIPDPPTYRACLAYLARTPEIRAMRPRPRAGRLKAQCREEHKDLQGQALRLLVTHDWVSEEAAKLGLKTTAEEVRRALPHESWARRNVRYLRAAGVRASDERFVLESQLLQIKLQRRVLPIYTELRRSHRPETPAMAERVDAALSRFSQLLALRWTPRTHCRVSIVIPECMGYDELKNR
jgi:hypothetical protein